jgi:hypothetical protein
MNRNTKTGKLVSPRAFKILFIFPCQSMELEYVALKAVSAYPAPQELTLFLEI